jgi:hypothetical protein
MSNTIDQAFVKQYSANIFHLSQQKGSKLRPFVRVESQKGEVEFFERLGPTAAIKKVSRHSDTPLINSDHSRRAVYLSDYEWADLIDKQDLIRTLIDPANPYVQAASWALGRSMDDEIVAAALGTAYAGKEGSTAVTLPATQYVGAVASSAVSNLNVATLIKVKEKFGVADVDESIPLHIAVSQKQISALLNENQVTSADYNAIKALVYGEVDTFMGFKFHRLERLPVNGSGSFVASINTSTGVVTLSSGNGNNARRAFAWAQDGIVLSTGMDIKARIDERNDKSYSTQVYACMSVGAVRLEESKVVGVLCTE